MKSILITGASSGLGFDLAEELSHTAETLIITGRNTERLHSLKEKCSKTCRILSFSFDLTSPKDREELCKIIDQEKPDLFIQNAGFGSYGDFSDIPYESSKEMLQVNVEAILHTTHYYIRIMKESNKAGKLVFISSLASFFSIPGAAVYAATKAFITSFAEALRFELSSSGIDVLTVCPGSFYTNFRSRAQGKALTTEGVSRETKKVSCKIVKAIFSKTGVYIPFISWKLQYWISRCIPNSWTAKALQGRMKKYSS